MYDPEEEKKAKNQGRKVSLNTDDQDISCQVAEV